MSDLRRQLKALEKSSLTTTLSLGIVSRNRRAAWTALLLLLIGVVTADEVDLGGRVVVVHLHIDGVDTDSARAEDRAEQTERN